ncbi:hypothetical protein Psta_2083 [Pirellula staleyi DSM 6068]|uniref:Uncharacterized protein n=1 Tax=Pirellula staleyi (strain ATCC 27377 / DSM 6068 / ICPB 4128) TaxID=530564 RepID=D2R1N8_PIRSD|nr:hypothetical protein Psta_2083 [Pirellula staleyi DSM 6068]
MSVDLTNVALGLVFLAVWGIVAQICASGKRVETRN